MFNEIIESNKYVIENAKYIQINKDEIKKFANGIQEVNIKNWLYNSPYNLLDENVETIITFLLYFEAIDFSFWGSPKWQIETSNGKEDGSMALMYAMLRYIRENKTFDNLTKENFKEYLKGNVEIPLFEERFKIIKNVNKVVNERFGGDFYNAIYKLTNDEELFKFIIDNFEDFKDIRTYEGKTIYFYKLAQLLTSDILHIREKKENIKVDCSHLVGCSDYKIPQGLRALKLVKYNKELADIVDYKVEIQENSAYEVEIRATVIYVIDEIKRLLNNKVSAIELNDYIWLMSKNKELPKRPYHLTRTTNY